MGMTEEKLGMTERVMRLPHLLSQEAGLFRSRNDRGERFPLILPYLYALLPSSYPIPQR